MKKNKKSLLFFVLKREGIKHQMSMLCLVEFRVVPLTVIEGLRVGSHG